MMDKKSLWNKASVGGAILGAVTLALHLLQGVSGALSILVWAVKFAVCIRLLRFLMQKVAKSDETVAPGDLFRFGALTSLLSAIIYSGGLFIVMTLIDPQMYTNAIEETLPVLEQSLSADEIDQIMAIMPDMPKYVLAFNLVYCTLFGVVVSSFSKNSFTKDNPF